MPDASAFGDSDMMARAETLCRIVDRLPRDVAIIRVAIALAEENLRGFNLAADIALSEVVKYTK